MPILEKDFQFQDDIKAYESLIYITLSSNLVVRSQEASYIAKNDDSTRCHETNANFQGELEIEGKYFSQLLFFRVKTGKFYSII